MSRRNVKETGLRKLKDRRDQCGQLKPTHQEDLGSETDVVGAVADLNRHLTSGEARAQNQKSLSDQIDEEAATRLKQLATRWRHVTLPR